MSDTNRPERELPVMLTLGLISALGSMAVHMFAPALPTLRTSMGIGLQEAQMVVSVYLFGLGVGQFLSGPLIDRIGRKFILRGGLILFITGSLVSALATDFESLVAARAVQAIGGAAGLVCARVLIVDLFGRRGGAGQQAKMMTIVLVSPALSPLLGGILADLGGWRLIPITLVLVAAIAFIASSRFLPAVERTNTVARAPLSQLPADIAKLLRNRAFVLATLTLASSSSALYIFLASGSFVMVDQYGLSPRAAGFCFLVIAIAGLIGTRLVRYIEARGDALLIGCGLMLCGSSLLIVSALAGISGIFVLLGCMIFLGVGAGISGPASIHEAVSAEAGLAGTGASLAGATQMIASGLATIPVGWLAPLTTIKLASAITLAAGLGCIASLVKAKVAPHRPADIH